MTASPTVVHKGDSVTYTAYETNNGDDALTPPTAGDRNSILSSSDATCSFTYSSGDGNNNNLLDPGETWTMSCTTSYSTTGNKTVTATGHGLDPNFLDSSGNPRDVTFCATANASKICNSNEQSSASATVINPSTATGFFGASPTSRIIHPGDSVTLTWTETNDMSSGSPGDNSLSNVHLTGDTTGCTAPDPTLSGGFNV